MRVTADLATLADRGLDAVVDLRRAIHSHPELAFDEHSTTARLRDRMRELGWAELPCPTPTGAVFELVAGEPGRSVLLRADIDALPVHEEVDVPWRSRIDGVMHACGHDAHAAVLVGVAAMIATRAESLAGRYIAVFQPAEETIGGARAMLDGGLLETARADVACGIHVAAPLPTGLVGTRSGVFYSACQPFTVEIRGSGGHAALTGRDGNVLLAASELASRLGEVVAGMDYEDVDCVCAAGSLHAGTASNVVPRTATVAGSIRTFTSVQSVEAVTRLQALAANVSRTYGVRAAPQLPASIRAVHNDPAATAIALGATREVIGADSAFEMPPITPSDDMSEILARVPGVYLAVGARPGAGVPAQHHSADFTIDEQALRIGVLTLGATAIALAGQARSGER
jgi:amidohydrolase